MRLIINTAHLRFGGAVQVALSFIQECRNFPEHEYHVFVGQGIAASLEMESFPKNFHFYKLLFGPFSFKELRQRVQQLNVLEKQINPHCVITTSGPSYWHSEAPQLMGFNLPLYIYPESPYLRSLPFWRKLKLSLSKRLHFRYFKRDAAAYIVQTDDVNKRVKKALKTDQVHTVTNNHNGFYYHWKKYPAKLPPRNKDEYRLLTLSSWYPHKNLDLIPEVIRELRKLGIDNVRFVLTLKGKDFETLNAYGEPERLVNVGPVKPEECPSLYDECDFMFLPTLAECFSASYPEAMVMEKPIITTDLGFAKSICGEAALYYKPKDPVAAAGKIKTLIEDPALQEKLVQKGKEQLAGFDTPFQRAAKYLNLCEELSKDRYGS